MVHELFEHDPYEMMAEVLRGRPVGRILDVGAHAGSASLRLLDAFPGAEVFAFEPVEASHRKLVGRSRTEPRLHPERLAVGQRSGEIEIQVNALADTSSALAPTASCARYHGGKVREDHRELVRLVSLDDWARERGAGAIEAMKIDVQGLELAVLHGAERLLGSSVLAILSEAQLTPLYEGASTFSEIDLFLRERGFELHQVCRIASAGPEQRTTCCDALWFRADVLDGFVERVTGAELAGSGAAP
ncbi:MAG: FkbM family methyltransferase [Phycisphaeraceae bacterium]|nr:FkbM family methyltransferase [Phycisphaeraceae bacterium]